MIYVVAQLIRLLELMFLARAIMSWFAQSSGSKIYEFLYMMTEPLIAPFRSLLSRFEFVRRFPIDISFLAAILTLELALTLLYNLF